MWTLVTAPDTEPLTLADAKAHLRYTQSAEDALIDSLITAARDFVEAVTRRRLITQTWDWQLPAFPAFPVAVPYPPLQSVTGITYRVNEVDTTWATANFRVLARSGMRAPRGEIVLTDAAVVPTADSVPDAVTVRVVQGYGDTPADVPEAIRHAMKLYVAELWVQRQITVVGTVTSSVQFTVEQLLAPYRDLAW